MTRHTPGPWVVGYGAAYRAAPGGGIDDESPRLLLADRSTPATTPTERDANIRRAVECVNALAGVEDPAATLASIAGFLEDVARGCDPDEAQAIAADLLALLGGAS